MYQMSEGGASVGGGAYTHLARGWNAPNDWHGGMHPTSAGGIHPTSAGGHALSFGWGHAPNEQVGHAPIERGGHAPNERGGPCTQRGLGGYTLSFG
jgi:hypothetical protein